ncbi:MAG TPA: carboxypeptidase-like regulatory domain-containing protein [Polyangiaceae bacterium]|nr:carboxypeptidase-like regulatory domain-containing protein [Polyangiaceae bacterium]
MANATLNGRVLDSAGLPIQNALLVLHSSISEAPASVREASTDERGVFRVRGVPRHANVTLNVWARGFEPRRDVLAHLETHGSLEVSLRRLPPLHAQVLDPKGDPLPSAVVVACTGRTRVELVSGVDGNLTLSPDAVDCLATAYHPRFAHSESVRVGAQGTVYFVMKPGGTIEGFASDPSGGSLPGLEFTIDSFEPAMGELPVWDLSSFPAEPIPRAFKLESLCPGVYTLSFRHRARSPSTITLHATQISGIVVRADTVTRGLHVVVGRTPIMPETGNEPGEPGPALEVTTSAEEETPDPGEPESAASEIERANEETAATE